ncbi:MAG: hypothetical protein DSM106950_41660 [Stigonema ocellatum SAG 48.90 = DSM 106950]|nr:hypothetical protein [Stigonema ocellatum SAG 48.90 = DSM 106950]
MTNSSSNSTMKKGADLLGLTLSYSELNELQSGKHISLEDRSLSEIGSVFILASALAAANSDKTKKTITFRDLPEAATDSKCCSGIPIYCWNSGSSGKICLYLTLVNGKPAIRTGYHSS